MDPVITLYQCPPLRARITTRQCATNRARARSASREPRRLEKSSALPAGPRECLKCRGVLWFREQSGLAPQALITAELMAARAAGEKRARQAPAAAERAEYPLRLEDVSQLLGLGRPM
jgi:hypothetical protein